MSPEPDWAHGQQVMLPQSINGNVLMSSERLRTFGIKAKHAAYPQPRILTGMALEERERYVPRHLLDDETPAPKKRAGVRRLRSVRK